jgi:hypothetical protein
MKRFLSIITIALFLLSPVFSQNEEKINRLEKYENNTNNSVKDTVSVVVGNEVFSIKESSDGTRVTLGNKEYRVVENDEGATVYKHDRKHDEDIEFYSRKHDRFRGHLGGIEFGFNGFLTDFWSTTLDPEDIYFDINTAKSNVWNIYLPNINLGITRHFGFVSTIGLNFNSYRFDGNNNINKNGYGEIGPLYPDSGIVFTKSKLYTTYLVLPLLLETQIPVNGSHHETVNISAGLIGAVKLCSKNKVVFDDGDKQKTKSKDDFSMNVLRWGATARLGYENFQVFGTTYFTQLFEKGKGPELYPYEVGIALTFN